MTTEGIASHATPSSAASRDDDIRFLARAWVDAHRSVRDEVDVALELVEGALPAQLRGVLYRNGPGRTEMNGIPYRHLFDGDGMITRFEFTAAGVRYRNRFVRTREYLEDLASATMRYRNFGTNRPGGFAKNAFRIRFKNTANTSVVHHGGRLLALWEAGLPHEIDPVTLETRSRFDHAGALLRSDSFLHRLLGRELPFSAHPKICPASGALYNFGLALGRRPTLCIYRVNARGVLESTRRVALDAHAFVHDFVLTERFCVFALSPVEFDMLRMFSGLAPPGEALTFVANKPTTLLVVPRDGGAARSFTAPPGFLFHWANGFDDGDRITLDGFAMDEYPAFPDLHDADRAAVLDSHVRPRLTRFAVDLTGGSVTRHTLSPHPGELPTIDPRRTGRASRHVWASAAGDPPDRPFFTGVAKYDSASGTSVVRDLFPCLTGEPVFVPRDASAREDDGYVLVTGFVPQVNRTDLFVLDAATLDTRARFRLPHHVPPGFHGTFVAARMTVSAV